MDRHVCMVCTAMQCGLVMHREALVHLEAPPIVNGVRLMEHPSYGIVLLWALLPISSMRTDGEEGSQNGCTSNRRSRSMCPGNSATNPRKTSGLYSIFVLATVCDWRLEAQERALFSSTTEAILPT